MRFLFFRKSIETLKNVAGIENFLANIQRVIKQWSAVKAVKYCTRAFLKKQNLVESNLAVKNKNANKMGQEKAAKMIKKLSFRSSKVFFLDFIINHFQFPKGKFINLKQTSGKRFTSYVFVINFKSLFGFLRCRWQAGVEVKGKFA